MAMKADQAGVHPPIRSSGGVDLDCEGQGCTVRGAASPKLYTAPSLPMSQ